MIKYLEIPKICPICGGNTVVSVSATGVENLICDNPNCEGKLVNRLDHYCGKKGMDIKGLSKKTLEKLIDWGWVNDIEDLYDLETRKKEWQAKSGFGPASVSKCLEGIEKSRNCRLWQFLSAIGIPEIGVNTAKILESKFKTWTDFRAAVDDSEYRFWEIEGFGEEMNKAIKNFNYSKADALVEYLTFETVEEKIDDATHGSMEGITFVITGKLKKFKNRDALKEIIEGSGGKVTGSVTKNTSYLINNDTTSTTAKNLTAQKLGVPIISEEDFLKIFNL